MTEDYFCENIESTKHTQLVVTQYAKCKLCFSYYCCFERFSLPKSNNMYAQATVYVSYLQSVIRTVLCSENTLITKVTYSRLQAFFFFLSREFYKLLQTQSRFVILMLTQYTLVNILRVRFIFAFAKFGDLPFSKITL